MTKIEQHQIAESPGKVIYTARPRKTRGRRDVVLVGNGKALKSNLNELTGRNVLGERLLLQEMSHRIKNELASAVSLISLAAMRSADAEARAVLEAAEERLQNFAHVHHSLQIPEYSTTIELSAFLQRLCQAIARSKLESRGIELSLSLCPIRMSSERCWLLGMIVFELITNAARHAFHDRSGSIHLELLLSRSFVECRVSDNGASAKERLCPGRGLRIVEALASYLGGGIDVQLEKEGTSSVLIFPLEP